MDQHNRYLWWDSPKSLCVKHKSSLNTVLKSCLKLLEAVRTVGWRFVLLSFDFSGYFKNVCTGHLVTKHYTSSVEPTWFIVSETRVQQTFALLLMRYIKFPFNISLRHKDGARERESERGNLALEPLFSKHEWFLWGRLQRPRSVAASYFNSKLSWAAQFWPTTALGHVNKLPMSHLFIFLLCISTVQRVHAEEMNVAGPEKSWRVSHQSNRFSFVFACVSKATWCKRWEGVSF